MQVDGLDLAELRSGWPASRVDASVRLARERLQVVLPDVFGDRKLAVSADVRLEGEQARVEKLEVILPYARTRLAGSVQLTGSQAFSIDGSLAGVDPKRVLEHLGLEAPAQATGELNGELQLRGGPRWGASG